MHARFGTRPRGALALGAALAALALAGCGAEPPQDEDEAEGRYTVEILDATFPEDQKLAKRSRMTLSVRNAGTNEIPNLTATVRGFDERGDFTDADAIADPQRPVFALDRLPKGSETAYVDTYALGRLGPGQTKTFTWDVTAVEPRAYRVTYKIAAGLDGKAVAVLPSGEAPSGEFVGTVERAAPTARVAPDGKTIVRDGRRIGPEDR